MTTKHDLTDDERLANLFDELELIDDEDTDYGLDEVKGMVLDFAAHCRRLRDERDRLLVAVSRTSAILGKVMDDVAVIRLALRDLGVVPSEKGSATPTNSGSPADKQPPEPLQSGSKAPKPPELLS